MRRFMLVPLAMAGALWGGVLPAQTPLPAKDQLKLVVILSRHGVRPPTWTNERLDAYAAKPWPQWSVAPGFLTAHGFQLLESFGALDRAKLAQAGLLHAKGCDDAAVAYVWADTDERTLESGKALAAGLFPGCGVVVHPRVQDRNDPLGHRAIDAASPKAAAITAKVSERLTQVSREQKLDVLLGEMQRILEGCAPRESAPCKPAHMPQTPLLGTPPSVVQGTGDHIVDVKGPLAVGSTFSEDLLLEYAEGMPTSSVGWGVADEAEIRRLLALHTAYFDLMHRTPALARMESAAMLLAIARTLQQGVEGKAVDGAVGPAGEKLVVMAGHDTNLAGVAGLLGLHWEVDGRRDDTPPGTELAFELWQQPGGGYTVRLRVAAQTLQQMRLATPLTPAAPVSETDVTVPGCGAACGWASFAQRVDAVTREP